MTAQQLSDMAKTALLDLGTDRQGTLPAPGTPPAAITELCAAGLMGEKTGLTRAGSIARQRISEQMMEAMFG